MSDISRDTLFMRGVPLGYELQALIIVILYYMPMVLIHVYLNDVTVYISAVFFSAAA